ncbi:MAG: N-acetyl-gamma-glutamyl-phosphate reductase [Actinobacteria bacterium]|nr:N-acetyl-gamma-glutamyl-phosphate reductase [Actinomycetota bacterium]
MARVAVIGAAGFAGALCADIVWRHPKLELTAVTARSDAGARLCDVHPRYDVPLTLAEFDADAVAASADAALVAYPHGAAAPVVAQLLERGLRVVDLSADFRLPRDAYESYYQPHEHAELLNEAVYGLTERYRDQIAGARLVANPGCYPTASILGLLPVADLADDVIVDAKSGVSGAGRAATDKTHFINVVENFSPYGVESHRHRAELEMELPVERITFTPHLLPLDQGLLASCYLQPNREIDAIELRERFDSAYADEPFIRLAGAPPGVRDVRDTNFCAIHATIEQATGRVLVFSAIDNLWKGAAGQAVQNLNLMLGMDERLGLVGGQGVAGKVAP